MVPRSLLLVPLLALIAAAPPAKSKRTPHQAAKSFQLDAVTPSSDATATDPATATTTATTATSDAPADPSSAPAATEPAPAPTPAIERSPATDATPAAMPTIIITPRTLDTPIADLIADPPSRAVLDRDMPGLSSDENLAKFRSLSLRALQPLTGGQLTDALLAKVKTDLAAIPASAPPPPKHKAPETGR